MQLERYVITLASMRSDIPVDCGVEIASVHSPTPTRSSGQEPVPKCHRLSANTSRVVVSVSTLGQFMRSFSLTMNFNEIVSLSQGLFLIFSQPATSWILSSQRLFDCLEKCHRLLSLSGNSGGGLQVWG